MATNRYGCFFCVYVANPLIVDSGVNLVWKLGVVGLGLKTGIMSPKSLTDIGT